MLDVDFLRTRPDFDRTLIYRYRSGVLRPRIRALITALAEREGCMRRVLSPQMYGLSPGSLFDEPVIQMCDFAELSASKARQTPAMLDGILEVIASGVGERSVLFVPVDSPLTQRSSWAAVHATCFAVDEVEVNRETLLPILRYLEASTDLADKPDLLSQADFVDSFDDLFERGTPDLLTLIHAFDDRVVTYTDPETNQYDQRKYLGTNLAKRRRASRQIRLRALLTNQDGWSVVALAIALDEQRWRGGRTRIAVTRELYRSTSRMLSALAADASPSSDTVVQPRTRITSPDTPARNCLLWAALLLSWEGRLVGTADAALAGPQLSADLLMVSIDRLGREFLARLQGDERSDLLADLWHALARTLESSIAGEEDKLANARRGLIIKLARSARIQADRINSPWLARLRRCLDETIFAADRAQSTLIERAEEAIAV